MKMDLLMLFSACCICARLAENLSQHFPRWARLTFCGVGVTDRTYHNRLLIMCLQANVSKDFGAFRQGGSLMFDGLVLLENHVATYK